VEVLAGSGEVLGGGGEVEGVEGVALLGEGEERFEGGRVEEGDEAAAGWGEGYASAVTSILLLPSTDGRHLRGPRGT
jgi:hypothetical protein